MFLPLKSDQIHGNTPAFLLLKAKDLSLQGMTGSYSNNEPLVQSKGRSKCCRLMPSYTLLVMNVCPYTGVRRPPIPVPTSLPCLTAYALMACIRGCSAS